jgi:outer membrane protein assembly factor BamA
VGFNIERSLGDINQDNMTGSRGVLFGRYVFQYSSSLYLPPMHYVEAFTAIQDHALPTPGETVPGADHFDHQTSVGIHYHLDLLTPYWDPESGFRLDASYQTGIPILGDQRAFNRVDGQFSFVRNLPEWTGPFLSESRLAARIYGAAALPTDGQFYTLGGANLFRGYDTSQRQGSDVWVASVEWRFPIVRRVEWDICDHTVGIRNIYGAAFYDVGNAYLQGHEVGPVAHAIGGGLRVDLAWLSIIERTTLRLDVAQALDCHSPVQFWFGIQHPF